MVRYFKKMLLKYYKVFIIIYFYFHFVYSTLSS